jgi:hypothetical protein
MGKKAHSDSIGRQMTKPVHHLFFYIIMFFVCALFAFSSAQTPTAGENSRLRSLSIDAYFDPARNFLAATARLRFAQPASERRLWLAAELNLSSVRSGTTPALDFKRESGLLLVQGSGEDEMELRYSGQLVRNQDSVDASWGQDIPETEIRLDDYCFLSYIKDFYPQPFLDFIPLKMNITVPNEWNCLGSGTLLAAQPGAAGKLYMFDNSEAKGMALVFGRFSQIGLVEGVIPIRLHGWSGFKYRNYFNEAEMARVLSFYNGNFGALNRPLLNILFRSGHYFSGTSYNGLIILNVDESWPRLSGKARKNIQAESPLSMLDAKTDLLAHELAHQWWGGLVSWKTPADNWITEGLATYSTLLFLRQCQGEKAYRKIRRKLGQLVKRYAKLGVPAAGFKLKLQNRDLRVYQALVYVKPALMLAALADTIGESELCLRLRTILKNRRCRNVDTAEFLDLLSAGDENLLARLKEWICSRGLPEGL